MKQTSTLTAMMIALLTMGSVATTAALAPVPAYAQKKDQKVGAKVGKPLKEAQDAAGNKDFKTALAKVKEAQAVSGKTAFEEFTINQFLAYVAANLGDRGTAATALENTIDSGFLDAQGKATNLKQAISMNYQAKRYDKALELSNRYLKEVGQDNEINQLVGQIHYLKKDYAKSTEVFNGMVNNAIAKGQTPRKDWLDLLASSVYNQGNTAELGNVLKKQVTYYPSKENWEKLLDITQRRPGLTDKANFDLYRLRYTNGLVSRAEDYIEMAQLAIQVGLPGEARTVLQKGFDEKVLGGANKERELRLFNMAKNQAEADEKGLAQFAKEAAAAKSGDPEVKLGEAYVSYGQAQAGIEAINRGIAKGNLKDADDAKLRLGLAYLSAGNKAEARKVFQSIKGTTMTATLAELWALASR